MKKLVKILLKILALFIVLIILAIGYMLVFERELVNTIYNGFTMSDEKIQEQLNQNKEKEQQAIKDAGLEIITIDKETEQKIASGEVSSQDVANMLMGQPDSNEDDNKANEQNNTEQQTPPSKDKTQQDNQEEPPPEQPEVKPPQQEKENQEQKQQIAELVAQMYVLKAQYTSEVEGIVDSMKKEYAALDESQKTTTTKMSIVSKYLNTISTMEAQCDAQVDSIIKKLRQALKDTGQDESLADQILQAYEEEKEITKSYYISKYS